MNQEIKKIFIIKLCGISLCMAVAWHMAVGPRVKRAQEINESFTVQTNEIEQGELAVGQYSKQLHAAIDQMSHVRDEIVAQLDVERKTDVHKLLQESAESFNLTVSRIEPLRTNIAEHIHQESKDEIRLETSEFRVECSGTYDGVVRLIESLSNSQNIAKVNSFRIIPVSNDDVRVIMQVAVYRLVEYPDTFTGAFGAVSAQLTSVGDRTDD